MGSTARFMPLNRWTSSASTITAFDEVSTFPASNTKIQQRSRLYRSQSLSGIPFLKADLGASYILGGVAFSSHNLTKDAVWHITVSNNSDLSSPTFVATGLNVWEPWMGTRLTEFSDSAGKPSAEMIKLLEFCAENPRVVRWHVFPSEVTGRYVRLQFDDPTNTDGYIEVAWCYAGRVISLDENVLYNWQIQPDDVVRKHISAYGQRWIDILHRKVRIKAGFNPQNSNIAWAFWQFLFDNLGQTGEMVLALRDDDLTDRFWFSLYCRLAGVPPMQRTGYEQYGLSIDFEELTG